MKPIHCISCEKQEMKIYKTSFGVEIRRCPKCLSIWLQKDQIYVFSQTPEKLHNEIENASLLKSDRKNPENGMPLYSVLICDNKIMVEIDPKNGGTWLDAGELSKIIIENHQDYFKGAFELVKDTPVVSPDIVLLTCADRFEGYEIIKLQGIVWGTGVTARQIEDPLMNSLEWDEQSLEAYRTSLDELRNESINRMIIMAKKKRSNGIINVNFTSKGTYLGAYDVTTFGTAVIIHPLKA